MPTTRIVLYKDGKENVPLFQWFDSIPPKARDKCVARLERLRDLGHELRRPEADYLRDGIYELRAKHNRINYRVLYFFHGRQAVVVSHGIVKQRADVPRREIELASERMKRYRGAPARHTQEEWSRDVQKEDN